MYSHYFVVHFNLIVSQAMLDINSPEVQDLIHSAVYGIGIHALECDDFQSLSPTLRMEVLREVEDLIQFEFGEAEVIDTCIDQLDPFGVEPFGRYANGVSPVSCAS